MITPTEMKDHAQNFLLWSLRFALVLSAIALFWIILQSVVANSADNIPACLTQKQARDKYPTAHLYWYYPDRKSENGKCWSNHRGGRPHRTAPAPITPTAQSVHLKSVRWYPQPFDAEHTPVDPPLLLNPADESLPGNIYWSEEPNEIDKLADRPPFIVWEERISGALQ